MFGRSQNEDKLKERLLSDLVDGESFLEPFEKEAGDVKSYQEIERMLEEMNSILRDSYDRKARDRLDELSNKIIWGLPPWDQNMAVQKFVEVMNLFSEALKYHKNLPDEYDIHSDPDLGTPEREEKKKLEEAWHRQVQLFTVALSEFRNNITMEPWHLYEEYGGSSF